MFALNKTTTTPQRRRGCRRHSSLLLPWPLTSRI